MRLMGLFRLTGLLLSMSALFAPMTARSADEIFADSFEPPFNIPASDGEAARFLNQATFGATAADISSIRSGGIFTWMNNQMGVAPTLSRAWLEAYTASLPTGSVSQDDRVHRWFNTAVTAPDQLRQRVAWALSQIIVASDRDANLSGEVIMMAEWNDLLVRNALGNYRTLLREATYSPMMARYLTYLRNRKFELNRSGSTFTAGNNGTQPDENYAREVMQLFSIGLLVRGNDFYTTYPDPANPGALRSTYTETDISELARVFTGLSYQCTQGNSSVGGVTLSRNCGANNTACTGIECRFTNTGTLFTATPGGDSANRGLVHPDRYKPLVCYPRYNDNGRDTSGAELETDSGSFNLPPGTPAPTKQISLGTSGSDVSLAFPPSYLDSVPLNCHATGTTLTATQQQACIDYCEGNIDDAIDLLFNHPNLPVMLARQLIQRMVTSNPTSAYVQRVALVFANNGSGVRGDLAATVRAVLMDVEARRALSDPLHDPNFGKAREPLLKPVAIWRHFGAISGDTGLIPATNVRDAPPNANPLAGQPSRRRWGPTNPQNEYEMRPLGAPTVFNFYEPDYRQPGEVTEAGLYSPELQIIHEVTSVATSNDLFARLCSGYGSNNCTAGNTGSTPPTDRAYFPTAQVDLIPSKIAVNQASADPTVAEDIALIEFFNARMMGGAMSGTIPANASCPSNTGNGMKGLLMNLLRCAGGLNQSLNGGSAGTTGGTRVERQRRKALYLMHLIAISPEYGQQR
jgi:uncharacterized protein (DUF1800 family)